LLLKVHDIDTEADWTVAGQIGVADKDDPIPVMRDIVADRL
jgi:hypothetical protein